MAANSTITKICFVAPKAYSLFNQNIKKVFGGAEVDLYLLATELAKDDKFEVSFITADYGQNDVETIENVRIIKSLSFEENPLSAMVKIFRAMKTADARIYFQETVSPGTFLVALFCKLNNRLFIYRTAHQQECDGQYVKKKPIASKAFLWSLENSAQVIVQNEKDKQEIQKTTGIDSIVIRNAHRLPELSQGQKHTILWVARSAAFKRPELFLELASTMPDEQFVMICQRAVNDKTYSVLTEKAEKIDNLKFIEHVPFDQIEDYFKSAKIFVNTSDSEGFPNTFIQACKHATPILSLSVNPDNFLDKYECGLCANGNWDTFISLFRTLSKPQEVEKYGQNARRYAEQNHNIEIIAQKYKELLLKLTAVN